MATLEQLYNNVMASDALRTAFVEALNTDSLDAFLKANNCDATPAQAMQYIRELQNRECELAEQELDAVAGGGCSEGDERFESQSTNSDKPVASIVNVCA